MSHTGTLRDPRFPRPGRHGQPAEQPAEAEVTSVPEPELPSEQLADQPAPAEPEAQDAAVIELTQALSDDQSHLRADGKCGDAYTTKVRGGGTKIRLCDKPNTDAGEKHTGPHGKVRQEMVLPDLAELASFEMVPDSERVEYGAGRNPEDRSEHQKKIDAEAVRVHDAWVAAGRPSKFNDCPRGRYFTTPELEQSYRSMLRSAATFNGFKLRSPGLQKHTSGRHMIVWTMVDQPAKPAVVAPVATAETASTPTATTPIAG
jgi:hypothetical protein